MDIYIVIEKCVSYRNGGYYGNVFGYTTLEQAIDKMIESHNSMCDKNDIRFHFCDKCEQCPGCDECNILNTTTYIADEKERACYYEREQCNDCKDSKEVHCNGCEFDLVGYKSMDKDRCEIVFRIDESRLEFRKTTINGSGCVIHLNDIRF